MLINIYLEMADLIDRSNDENLSESELENIGEEYMFLMDEITNKEKPLDLRLTAFQSDFEIKWIRYFKGSKSTYRRI